MKIKNSKQLILKKSTGSVSASLIILGFLIIGLATALSLVPKRQEIRKKAFESYEGYEDSSLSPPPLRTCQQIAKGYTSYACDNPITGTPSPMCLGQGNIFSCYYDVHQADSSDCPGLKCKYLRRQECGNTMASCTNNCTNTGCALIATPTPCGHPGEASCDAVESPATPTTRPCSVCDFTGDGRVCNEDRDLITPCWGHPITDPNCARYDVNGDATIDLVDSTICGQCHSQTCPSPTPTPTGIIRPPTPTTTPAIPTQTSCSLRGQTCGGVCPGGTVCVSRRQQIPSCYCAIPTPTGPTPTKKPCEQSCQQYDECQSGYCHPNLEICRNPNCPDQANCICPPTPTGPTPTSCIRDYGGSCVISSREFPNGREYPCCIPGTPNTQCIEVNPILAKACVVPCTNDSQCPVHHPSCRNRICSTLAHAEMSNELIIEFVVFSIPTPTPTGTIRPTPTSTACHLTGQTCGGVCPGGTVCVSRRQQIPSCYCAIPTPTGPTPTKKPCGQSCQLYYECQSGYCEPNIEICRNPNCPDQVNCTCPPTPTGPTMTPSTTPHPTSTPLPTPTFNPNAPNLRVKINFFGVRSLPTNPTGLDYRNRPVLLIIHKSYPAIGENPEVYRHSFNFRAVVDGNKFYYENTDLINPNIPAGKYNLLLKGPQHLKIKKKRLDLIVGSLTFDFSQESEALPGGDLPLPVDDDYSRLEQDKTVNSMDFTQLVNNFNKTEARIINIGDLNLDGIINAGDTSVLAHTLEQALDEDE